MGYHVARLLVYLIFKILARVQVTGFDRLPQSGGYIIASNHIGRLDGPLVFYLLNRRDVAMMVAEKYREVAFFRWAVKQVDGIWVDRFNADFSALRKVLGRLKQGQVVVLAPEGTRSQSGSLNLARSGTSFLAVKGGVPVVPVGVVGTYDPQVVARLKRLRKLDIQITVGEPFTLPPVPASDREAALQAYTDEIMCRIAALLPEEMRGVYVDYPRLGELLQT